jgi:formate/nitrite transporter FocA (FNT family)
MTDDGPLDAEGAAEEAGEPEVSSQKSYAAILVDELIQGLQEHRRPTAGLLFSGFSAGLDIGFSVLLMAVLATLADGQLPSVVVEIMMANLYAVGFVFVVLGRSELFTEHTTLAVYPVLGGEASIPSLGRLWGLIYAANLAGAAVFSGLLVVIGPELEIVEPTVLGEIAGRMVGYDGWIVLLSGLLAGWLMGLMSWLVAAAEDTISQVFFVWLVATAIGLSGLHHCIVGSVEVLSGLFAGTGVSAAAYAHFLLWSTVGNAVGGVLFVALLKYGHASRPGDEAPSPAAE